MQLNKKKIKTKILLDKGLPFDFCSRVASFNGIASSLEVLGKKFRNTATCWLIQIRKKIGRMHKDLFTLNAISVRFAVVRSFIRFLT